MKTMDHINWGIVGCGDVCEVKSGPALYKTPHSSVGAVMRRNGAKARDFAERHGVPKWYDDAAQLIRDPDINAIYIATPPASHAEYALQAAAAGKPAYVEKPMARTHAECLEMIKAFQEAGLPLFVAYYRRALPHFLWVKERIDEGLIGSPRYVSIELCQPLNPGLIADSEENWRIDPDLAGGGYFYDLASHQLDFLDFVFGPIRELKGIKTNLAGTYAAADTLSASFEFDNGTLGTGIWCFCGAANAQRDTIRIVGETGYIELPTFGAAEVRWANTGMEERLETFELPPHIQQPLIQQIVDVLRGKRKDIVSSGTTAARTNWALEQVAWRR